MPGLKDSLVADACKPGILTACVETGRVVDVTNVDVGTRCEKHYGTEQFEGACVDSDARTSVIGYDQARVYCALTGLPFRLARSQLIFRFHVRSERHNGICEGGKEEDRKLEDEGGSEGEGECESKGRLPVRLPTPDGAFVALDVDVVRTDVPLLVGRDALRRGLLRVEKGEKMGTGGARLVHAGLGWSVALTQGRGDRLFMQWPPSRLRLTRSQLGLLHRRFFHPEADRRFHFIRRACPSLHVSPIARSTLARVAHACRTRSRCTIPPFCFRVTLPPRDAVVFNDELAVDLVWVRASGCSDGNLDHADGDIDDVDNGSAEADPVLHVADTQTHFQHVARVQGNAVRDVWRALVVCWVAVYVGYPDLVPLFDDSADALASGSEWTRISDASGLYIDFDFPHISPASAGVYARTRYHDPFRRVYDALRTHYPHMEIETSLRYAVKGINDTMGPEGLVASLLVFGTVPTAPTMNKDIASQLDHVGALDLARKEMSSITIDLRDQKTMRSNPLNYVPFLVYIISFFR